MFDPFNHDKMALGFSPQAEPVDAKQAEQLREELDVESMLAKDPLNHPDFWERMRRGPPMHPAKFEDDVSYREGLARIVPKVYLAAVLVADGDDLDLIGASFDRLRRRLPESE